MVEIGYAVDPTYRRRGYARAALESGTELNGYPIVVHGTAITRAVLAGVADDDFVVQVRHGSPNPEDIVAALVEIGLHATEGGPVSYCLPYSRTPLVTSVEHWARACERLTAVRETGVEPHLETFGGCMMGQLCPPSLLVAISVLEAMFFRQHGLRSVSLSYAQQTNPDQDREAVSALGRLAAERLGDVESHLVVYAYMGVYPRTRAGATRLLVEHALYEAARLAVRSGAARLIVKTAAEAFRIPTITDNIDALQTAAAAAAAERRTPVVDRVEETGIYAEASTLIDAVLELGADVGRALAHAFRLGYLDVPYCLHPDNAGRARSAIDPTGRLGWSRLGSLPIRGLVRPAGTSDLTAAGLLTALSYVERRYDAPGLDEYLVSPIHASPARRELKGAKT